MNTINLGGRKFTMPAFEQRTILQDHAMRTALMDGGLDRVMPEVDESHAVFLARLDVKMMASPGCTVRLVAALLVPSEDFSSKTHKEVADFLGRLNDPDDRERVQEIALQIVIGFYEEGLRRLHGVTAAQWAARKQSPVRRFFSRLLGA